MDDALRFLELVCRELRCADAFFQLGGEPPSADETLGIQLDEAVWLVARFEAGLADAGRELAQAKLAALLDSFSGLARDPAALLTEAGVIPSAGRGLANEQHEAIDDALALLADKAGALAALVIDEDSPVLWGSSAQPRPDTDVEAAVALAELVDSASLVELDLSTLIELDEDALGARLATLESDKLRQRLLRKLPAIRERSASRGPEQWATHFLTCRAIAAIRRAPERHKAMLDDLGWLARDFGGIYHVIVVFDGPFDELHATPPLLRALPVIERLVLALPPIDPTPGTGKGRVLRLLR